MRAQGRGARRGVWWGVLALGIGLIAAPVVFQMFDRAPKGGDMIDAFAPYMTEAEIAKFEGYLDEIGAAVDETQQSLDTSDAPLAAALVEQWPAIDADMSDMLATMSEDIGDYEAVAALPPFDLFAWFFVAPGALLVLTASVVLIRSHRGRPTPAGRWIVGVIGIGLVLAPAAFQMFTRAPKGGDMIDDFRTLMTRERVQDIQGYFVTLGGGEGQLRTVVVPAALDAGTDPADLGAVMQFSDDWQTILGDFAPMIGVMADNVDNFEAVDALPDFPLFPWFFVVPGLLAVGLAVAAGRGPDRAEGARDDNDTTTVAADHRRAGDPVAAGQRLRG